MHLEAHFEVLISDSVHKASKAPGLFRVGTRKAPSFSALLLFISLLKILKPTTGSKKTKHHLPAVLNFPHYHASTGTVGLLVAVPMAL